MEAKARVRQFVVENFYVTDPAGLDDEASLLDRGIIDSTGVLEVIAFLERELHVVVADEEMVPENLDSIARLARYVESKKA